MNKYCLPYNIILGLRRFSIARISNSVGGLSLKYVSQIMIAQSDAYNTISRRDNTSSAAELTSEKSNPSATSTSMIALGGA